MRPRHLTLALLAALLPGCSATKPAGDGGWRSLFNGHDLTGWRVKCAPADESRTFWKVHDGAILADSMDCRKHDYVWLVTEKEYTDFAVRLKFQAYHNSPGNSGVQIRSRYDDTAHWLDGPQVDINPPGPWRTGMIWDETRGSSRWLYPAIPKGKWVDESMAVKGLKFIYADESAGWNDPAGARIPAPTPTHGDSLPAQDGDKNPHADGAQIGISPQQCHDENSWNDLEIEAIGPHIRVSLNGLQVTDYNGSADLNDAVHRERNVGTRGHIALQIHRNDQLRIRFRDISIREFKHTTIRAR